MSIRWVPTEGGEMETSRISTDDIDDSPAMLCPLHVANPLHGSPFLESMTCSLVNSKRFPQSQITHFSFLICGEWQHLENKIIADLQGIFMNLERGLQSVDTYNLANSLNHLKWTVNKQQDLEEFFQMVINAIDVEDVRKVYEVALLDSLTCLRCNTETTTMLSYLDISLPLSMDASARLKGSFVTLPQVLVIHLNRFVYDIQHQRHVKLERPVDIPHTLRFKKDSVGYVPVCQTDEGYEHFKLFSICVHCGDLERGHYYAYIRHHENDQWYLCNDSAVRKVMRGGDVEAKVVYSCYEFGSSGQYEGPHLEQPHLLLLQ
ncbi:UBP13 hydrolase, partial [Polypterus senegalus]